MEKKKKNRRMRNPNGLGTCYKLSGKRRKPFMVRIPDGISLEMIDGKPKGTYKYKTLGYFETYEEGMFALYKYNDNPYDLDARLVTFDELWQRVYERDIEKLSKIRKACYGTAYNYLHSIKDRPICELKTLQLQKVIDDVGTSKYKVTADMKGIMLKVFQYAGENDIVDKNYATFVRALPQVVKGNKTVFTQNEIDLLFANDDNVAAKVILILIYSGMRISELLSMKIDNVHLNERYMIGGLKTEAGKNRVIPINNKILKYINYFCSTNKNYLIEINGKSVNYPNYLNNYFIPLMHILELKHTIHETRHTFVSLMDSANCNPATLKRIVGHKSSDITFTYTHKSIEELVDAVNLI